MTVVSYRKHDINDRISLPGAAGFVGAAISPPVDPGQRPDGVQGAKPPEAPATLQYTVPKNAPKKPLSW